jgi:hypothetical protein
MNWEDERKLRGTRESLPWMLGHKRQERPEHVVSGGPNVICITISISKATLKLPSSASMSYSAA